MEEHQQRVGIIRLIARRQKGANGQPARSLQLRGVKTFRRPKGAPGQIGMGHETTCVPGGTILPTVRVALRSGWPLWSQLPSWTQVDRPSLRWCSEGVNAATRAAAENASFFSAPRLPATVRRSGQEGGN